MMPYCCRLLSVLFLLATGCVYTPVRFDPVTGFQTGGGVDVMCGGPLDPWMLKCGNPCGCLSCLFPCCDCCPTSVCEPAPICPTPICPTPICPAPICPSPGLPVAPMGSPLMPTSGFPMMGPAPTPTFAQPCDTCSPTSGHLTAYPQSVGAPIPNTMNYSQLFHSPPMAPPAVPYHDPFQMPAPLNGAEVPPAPGQLPPHYDNMEPPADQPMPPTSSQAAPPMQQSPQQQPMPMTSPMPMPGEQPMQTPMPMGPEATQTSYPHLYGPGILHQGVVPSGTLHQDSRRVQWVPVRL